MSTIPKIYHLLSIPNEIMNIIYSFLDSKSCVRLNNCQKTKQLFNSNQIINLRMKYISGYDFEYEDLKHFTIVHDIRFTNCICFNSPIQCNNYIELNNFDSDTILVEIEKCELSNELKRLYNELISILNKTNDPMIGIIPQLRCIRLEYKSNSVHELRNISSTSEVGLYFNIELFDTRRNKVISNINLNTNTMIPVSIGVCVISLICFYLYKYRN